MLFRFLNLATAAALAAGSGLRTEERDLAGQPSAKFAATWREDEVVAADCVNYGGDLTDSIWENSEYLASVDLDVLCAKPDAMNATMTLTGDTVFDQVVPLGAIKIPNDKEILVTFSTQASIFTINTATSKKGGGQDQEFYGNIGATSAMAGLDVRLVAVNAAGDMTECAPGKVTMASRYVELRNRIGGNVTYEDCYGDSLSPTCEIKIADVELESSIGIALDTTAAHSFQWVCADMDSDVYDVKAMFSLTAEANDLCESTLQNDCDAIPVPDLAAARIILGKRIMTIQQVRAVKGSLELA